MSLTLPEASLGLMWASSSVPTASGEDSEEPVGSTPRQTPTSLGCPGEALDKASGPEDSLEAGFPAALGVEEAWKSSWSEPSTMPANEAPGPPPGKPEAPEGAEGLASPQLASGKPEQRQG